MPDFKGWAEDDHPRDANGEFASGGGSFAEKVSRWAGREAKSEKHGLAIVRTREQLAATGAKNYAGFPLDKIQRVHEFSGDTGLKAVVYRTDRNGKDVQTYVYTAQHKQQQADKKFAKADRMAASIGKLRTSIDKDAHSADRTTRECAIVLKLVDATTMRIGGGRSEEATGSVGATSLRGEHVSAVPGGARVQFQGKSGKQWDRTVKGELGHTLVALASKSGKDGRLFGVNAGDVNRYLSTALKGTKLTAKDFRTYHGSAVVHAELKAMSAPRTVKEAKANVTAAIARAAEHLGNTPAICRSAYVNPRIIDSYMNSVLQKAGRK
jgi:DNA topoisomerase-1